MYNCDICSLTGLNEPTLASHVAGKRHLKNVEISRQNAAAELSILVKPLPRRTPKNKIIEFFNTFGTVVSCTYQETRAIIEFETKESVDKVLNSQVRFQDKPLTIKRQGCFNDKLQKRRAGTHAGPLSSEELAHVFKGDCTFETQCKLLLDAIQLTDTDLTTRYDPICDHLNRIFAEKFPLCRTYKFGSTQTGLAFKESDLDIYLNVEPNVPLTTASIFKEVKKIIYFRRTVFSDVIPIPKARIPIIKFRYIPTNVQCDLSLKAGFGTWNSHIIRYCLSLDVRLKPLMMLIKFWTKRANISGCGKITNYALIMLIIFFLQQPSVCIIPPLMELRKKCEPCIINGWQVNFDSDPDLPVITNKKTIPELLKEFFMFYQKFDFKSKVVCPLSGTTIPENDFVNSVDNLPPCMKTYTDFISTKDPTALLLAKGPMCVQDPIELNANITACVTQQTLNSFQFSCEMGAQACESTEKNDYKNLLTILFTKLTTHTPKSKRGLKLTYYLPEQLKLDRTNFDATAAAEDWYLTVCKTIKAFLEKVMLMEVEVLYLDNEAKQQKIETLSDVHTKDHDNLKLICRGNKYFRRYPGKTFGNILSRTRNLSKQVMATEQVVTSAPDMDEYEPSKLEFECRLKKVLIPVCVELMINNICTDARLLYECCGILKVNTKHILEQKRLLNKEEPST